MRCATQLTLALATVGAMTLATIDQAVQASPAICHNYIVTGKTASAASVSKAKERARAKWSDKAVSVKGGRWGSWRIAKQKQYLCGRAGLVYCKAKAVPCLTAASSSSGPISKTKPANGRQSKPIN